MKRLKRLIFILIILSLIFNSTAVSFGAPSSVKAPLQVKSFKSTDNLELEYLKANVTKKDQLKVVYQTPIETSLFRLSLYRVGKNKGDINLDIFVEPVVSYDASNKALYQFTYYLDAQRDEIDDGYYNLYIRRCKTPNDAENLDYKSSGVLYKNMEIKVSKGKFYILKYNDIVNYNKERINIAESYELDRYLDNTLSDVSFILRNPATNITSTMTWDKINYIKRTSDRITAGSTSDYEKLIKIYEFVAENFYYDTIAFQTHSLQYADPYENLRNLEYKLYSANSRDGVVYTTCQGYSGMFLALARAQNIPTRFVYGHRLAVPSNDWRTESNIDVLDHWWAEAYVDGRWIFVDPTVGTTNKYNKNTGEISYTGLTNYTYFDPSEDQIATSHMYFNVYPDYRNGKYISDYNDTARLSDLLQYKTAAFKYNGQLMDNLYNIANKDTWGDGTKTHFMTDGHGRLTKLQWYDKGLEGELNLSNCQELSKLSMYKNKFTSATITNCPKLNYVYLYDNQLSSVDAADSPKIIKLNAKNNPLNNVVLYFKGANRTFSASEGGSFSFDYNSKDKKAVTITAKEDIGYKLLGVYNASTEKRISKKTTSSFNPTVSSLYQVIFEPDPDSFKYELRPYDAVSDKLPYIQAMAKRLNQLGYYDSPYKDYWQSYLYGDISIGEEQSYTSFLADAVRDFKINNLLEENPYLVDAIVDEATWSAMFNPNCPSKSDLIALNQ